MIMTEILPYLNIFPDQVVTGQEDYEMTYFINNLNEQMETNRQKMAMEAFRKGMGLDDNAKIRVDSEGNFYAEQTVTNAPQDDTEEESSREDLLTEEEGIKESTDDPNVPAPPEDTEDTVLDNKLESDGITNDEAARESGE